MRMFQYPRRFLDPVGAINARSLEQYLREVSSRLADISWTAASLQNSWVDYGLGHQTARYGKDAAGVVHVQGFIKSGTTTNGTLIFTLPSGYRPDATLKFVLSAAAGAGVATADVNVQADGQVLVKAGFSTTWTTLNFSFAV